MNTQDWSPLGWTGWISLQSKGLSRNFPQHHSSKASTLQRSAFFIVQLSYPYMTTGKTIALTRQTFAGKVMFLLFNMLSRLLIAFLPRSKRLLISWLRSPSTVILEPPHQNKICHCFHCFPLYLPWSDGTGWCDQSFLVGIRSVTLTEKVFLFKKKDSRSRCYYDINWQGRGKTGGDGREGRKGGGGAIRSLQTLPGLLLAISMYCLVTQAS